MKSKWKIRRPGDPGKSTLAWRVFSVRFPIHSWHIVLRALLPPLVFVRLVQRRSCQALIAFLEALCESAHTYYFCHRFNRVMACRSIGIA
jgi:hypothetical protein